MEQRAKILVADDDELLLEKLVSALKNTGAEVDRAVDGKAALSFLDGNSYDLVVTDIRMPHLDGLELIARLRERSPATRFIAVTGYASVETAVACLRFGASDFLVKPFELADFLDSVKVSLEKVSPFVPDKGQADNGSAESTLTQRECEVLKWAREGKNNWEIGTILNITEATVKYHLANSFKKLGVTNRAQAVAKSISLKLI